MTDQSAHCGEASAVQAPGRDAATENFPVASWLLPKATRPHVLAFYRFARAADDIADDPALAAGEKVAALDRILAVFDGAAPRTLAERAAADHVASLAATALSDLYARQILQAFRRDAENPRCRTWSDLMLYCRYSAVPVGRFLIDLHGEATEAHAPADALCTALQVLNHLQDCGDDLVVMDRVYLPLDWIEADGASLEELRGQCLSPGLRRTVNRCLDRADQLIAQAGPLPGLLTRSRLRWEAAVVVRIACRLARLLRCQDPLARRVELTRRERLVCLASGLMRGWRAA